MIQSAKNWLPLVLVLLVLPVIAGCDDDDDPPLVRSAMTWSLLDACDDGRGIQAALFDFTYGGVYPSRDRVYLADPGGSVDVTIDCPRGAQVCYGAETDPAGNLFWGVGIDGTEGCDDCCETCGDILVEFDLLCAQTNGSAPLTSRQRGTAVRRR